jgi:hypothetical protein
MSESSAAWINSASSSVHTLKMTECNGAML